MIRRSSSRTRPYTYDATIEIKPDIGDIDFKGLNLDKTPYTVNEKEIDSQLKALQKNLTQQKPIEEDRPAAEGDHVMITYEGLKDGKPFTETQRTENFTLRIGDGSILKDFDTGLIGMKADETKEVRVTFPRIISTPNWPVSPSIFKLLSTR